MPYKDITYNFSKVKDVSPPNPSPHFPSCPQLYKTTERCFVRFLAQTLDFFLVNGISKSITGSNNKKGLTFTFNGQ